MPHRDPDACHRATLAWKDRRRPAPEDQVDRTLPQKGAIIFSPDGEWVQCHICGAWKRALQMHTLRAHGVPIADYKDLYGIARTTSLWPPALQDKQRAAAIARDQGHRGRQISADNPVRRPAGIPWQLSSRATKSASRKGIAPRPRKEG
jgi:hypothetical protein